MMNVLRKVAAWDKPIPAVTEKECGNYKDHDLDGAKKLAADWVRGIERKGWRCFA